MTDMGSKHYSTERLNAALDGELSAAERARLEEHVQECAPCREEFSRISETVTALRSLPTSARTPEGLWAGIESRMAAAPAEDVHEVKVLELPSSGPRERRYTFSMPQLAAAAVLVALVSASLVLSTMGGGTPAGTTMARTAGDDMGPAARSVSMASSRYEEVVGELERILDSGREVLASETLETIDASLETIEAAITEVEVALAADPASDMLMRMLTAHQRTKLGVLQRAADAVQSQI